MENYIVRIYRRANNNLADITGIVEKPDSGENISFNSNEEFINIFIPPEFSTSPTNRNQVVEQRKYRRFVIRNSTLIFDSTTDVGEIVDISLGGLSFICPNMSHNLLKGSFDIGILCEGSENFSTGRISCKNLMARYSDLSRNKSRKRFTVEFDTLKPIQRMELEYIIKRYAVCEV